MKNITLSGAIGWTYSTLVWGVLAFIQSSVIFGIIAIISLFFTCLGWYDVIMEAVKIKEKEKIEGEKDE